ncbi:ABC transporter permease [Thalassotalea ganghwensis]
MNISRFWAVVKARNIEFFRDKSSLSWSLLFPILLLVAMSLVFSGDGKAQYKIGVINLSSVDSQFIETRYIDFVDYQTIDKAQAKLSQHAVDLVIDFTQKHYWMNPESPQSYLAEQILKASHPTFDMEQVSGKKIRYVDWVLPGVLGMNMMFSCLFGVGYVIVRYRKNAVLKRLKATPLTALEFVSAQLFSRALIVMTTTSLVYVGCNFFFDFYMLGSYVDLFLIGLLGAFSLISLGLLIASRSKSEELIGGLLNFSTWPMMILSGVWFSLEGAPDILKLVAEFLPLTHLVAAARAVITEGATLAELGYHIFILLGMSVMFLGAGAWLFNWNEER